MIEPMDPVTTAREKGERYTGRFNRCRVTKPDGTQCKAKAARFVSYYAICINHHKTLTVDLKPLSFVEL